MTAILESSLKVTLEDLAFNFNAFIEALGDEFTTDQHNYVVNLIESYNATIQQLSPEEKEIVALIYQANKSFFDEL